ncbi:MAG TPA: rod shape-determining protein MreD [Bacteroidia bacterium]|nr:rod shape-determining protein MreD [Bacteroidia bacterium]
MINQVVILSLRFILLVLLQVLILNNIELSGYINPYLYILFILLLPVQMSGLMVLSLAFVLGLVIDVFSNTPGMHAAASVITAFVRPTWLKMIAPRDGYESDAVPGIQNFTLTWFLLYASILILVHHLALFYIEVFRFSNFFQTLFRVFSSSIATLLLVILSLLFLNKAKEKR